MMKYIFISIFVLTISSYSQPEFISSNPFEIKKWSIKIEKKDKIKLIQDADIPILSDMNEYALSFNEDIDSIFYKEIDNFYFGYFDKDTLIDIIYNGFFWSEGTYSIIYLNTNKGYRELIHVRDITELIYNSTSILPQIQDLEHPCCEDDIYTIHFYIPTYDQNYKISQTYYYVDGTIFSTEFDYEIEFVINNECHLRKSPKTDNTFIAKYERIGNISHTYMENCRGVAFSKMIDKNEVWWFVQIINPASKKNKHFPPKGTCFLGWVNQKDIKFIN